MSKKIGQDLYDKIEVGDLSIPNDELQLFLSIYPKEEEITSLKNKIERLGVYSFKDALS